MQLFYNPDISENTEQVSFSKEESRHIVRVLRKTIGDKLNITDGKGNLFEAEISQALDKKCTVHILGRSERPKTWNCYIHLAMAPTKMNDRFEWFLEKATEIGIDEISPIICEHSERKQLKIERMEKVILSAMKQSLKFERPILNPIVSFKEFIEQSNWDLGLIAHCEDGNKKDIKSYLPSNERIVIMIGPEGDFSASEIAYALEHGLKPISLGESRLRTETAGIVACHSVHLLNSNEHLT